ncbi:MAG: peptide deformylase [Bacteroidales bacterium]|nr:peptide deformylase [Bacteroidales bacterium]MDD2425156.1 peptide deformylase [Bacteroidales bacterium]MDD3989597.1 peptide deformylase [Bacteroidales bacterium]
MVLPVYVYGTDILREKAAEANISGEQERDFIKKLVEDMEETMLKADGVGLAAPQVGHSLRVLIVNGSLLAEDNPELRDFKRTMINPRLLWESDEQAEYSEGCLSIPEIHAAVTRPAKIRVSYTDGDFNNREEEFQGFACRMVQHEMDHLEGILFTDRTAPIRRKMLQSRLNNIRTGKVNTFYKTVAVKKGK